MYQDDIYIFIEINDIVSFFRKKMDDITIFAQNFDYLQQLPQKFMDEN